MMLVYIYGKAQDLARKQIKYMGTMQILIGRNHKENMKHQHNMDCFLLIAGTMKDMVVMHTPKKQSSPTPHHTQTSLRGAQKKHT